MAVWPVTLPDRPLLEGYREQAPDLALRTEMDSGPAKARRRFTAGVRPIALELVLTDTQVDTLDAFYLTTLEGGALPFDWTHPRTEAEVEFRFRGTPTYVPLGPDLWQATLELEVLP